MIFDPATYLHFSSDFDSLQLNNILVFKTHLRQTVSSDTQISSVESTIICTRTVTPQKLWRKPTSRMAASPSVINLNVGGHSYSTTLSTILRYPDSMLSTMFSGQVPLEKDLKGRYFIDRDGQLFRYVLNFLRSGVVCLPRDFSDYQQLLQEADFYQLPQLYAAVRSSMKKSAKGGDIIQVRCARGPSYRSCSVSGMAEVIKEIFPDGGRDLEAKLDVDVKVNYRGFDGTGASVVLPDEFSWSYLISLITSHGFRMQSVGCASDLPNQACEIWAFIRNQ